MSAASTPGDLPTPFTRGELRTVLGTFATGVTVVSTRDIAGHPQGLTVNSFNSVSLDPPLILWSIGLNAPEFAAFRAAERFAVNILAEAQRALSDRFATTGIDKFAGVAVRAGLGDMPLLEDCTAILECRTETAIPGGDHLILIGRVEKIHYTPRPPLIFHGGRYIAAGLPLAEC